MNLKVVSARWNVEKLISFDGFHDRMRMRVVRLDDGSWKAYDITGKTDESGKTLRDLNLGDCESWMLEGAPVRLDLVDKSRHVMRLLVKDFGSAWDCKFCRVAGCNCTGGKWTNRDVVACKMILVMFVFLVITGRSLMGYYVTRQLKTAHRLNGKDLYTSAKEKEEKKKKKKAAGTGEKKTLYEKYSYAGRVTLWNRAMYGATETNFKKAFTAWLWWVVYLQERGCSLKPKTLELDEKDKKKWKLMETPRFGKTFNLAEKMPEHFPCLCGSRGCEKPVKL